MLKFFYFFLFALISQIYVTQAFQREIPGGISHSRNHLYPPLFAYEYVIPNDIKYVESYSSINIYHEYFRPEIMRESFIIKDFFKKEIEYINIYEHGQYIESYEISPDFISNRPTEKKVPGPVLPRPHW